MKKKIQVVDVENEGLLALLGEHVQLWCMNYIYTGVLEGVNEACVKLTEAKVVYETGVLTADRWKDAQDLGVDWYVQISAIESYGLANKK